MAVVCSEDYTFGPIIRDSHCRGTFDFTLKFEETVFGILPQCLFILPIGLAIWHSTKSKSKVSHFSSKVLEVVSISKRICCILYVTANLLTLVFSSIYLPLALEISLTAVEFLASILISILIFWHYARYSRPSHLVQFYFFNMLLFLSARLRTLCLIKVPAALEGTSCLKLALAIVILILESLPGVLQASAPLHQKSPDDYIGLFSYWFLPHLLKLFWTGRFLVVETGP
jgi:ATP-binding cassette, subfamily C (CFTR/MRP), member 1